MSASGLAALRRDNRRADVSFVCEGKCIATHRLVLVSASAYFRALLEQYDGNDHPVIVLRNVNPRHFNFMLDFIFGCNPEIPIEDVEPLMKLADRLEVSGPMEQYFFFQKNTKRITLPASTQIVPSGDEAVETS